MKRLLAAFAFLIAASVAPDAAAARACAAPVGAQILARHGGTVVWSVESNGAGRAVACAGRRTVVLETADGVNWGFGLSRLRFAGRWLAYVNLETVSHYGERQVLVTEVDLLGARGRRSMFLGDLDGFDVGPQISVTGLAVDRDGALAWRQTANVEPWGGDVPPYSAVGVFDRNGGRFVARTAPGAISRFRLHGSGVAWTVSGAPASATMRGRASCPRSRENCWKA